MEVEEVAALLGVRRARAYQLIAAGLVPSVRLTPGRVRVPREAFSEWLRAKNAEALQNVRERVPA